MLLVDQESLLEKTLHPKDNMHDTTDESEETLSLCDLQLYSDHQSVEEWQQDSSAQSQGSSSIPSSEQDYFEFSSPSTTGFPPESIIFCGKLIPYKKKLDTSDEDSSKLVETKRPSKINKKRGWGLLRWIFSLSKNNRKSTTPMHKDQSAKKKYNNNKHGKGYDYPVHKMSLLTSSTSGKARWYLFGVSRFSSEVQLKDIKGRLSSGHHCPSPPPPSPATLSSGSGLTGLIRVLSCGGNHHPNTMVIASTSFSRQK